MKYLIMCEGSNELEIVNILLQKDLLTIKDDDLLGLKPYHARQINSNSAVKLELNIYPGNDVCVLRIGDTLTEKLTVPDDYANKIINTEKYCTKPELEVLLIIAENLWGEYEKKKSSVKPKDFAKSEIVFNGLRYNNSTLFYKQFFENRTDLLIYSIKEYKRLKKHKKDEMYLADLLKE